MFQNLSENHLDQLQQDLIVPLAVMDILNHNLPLEPDMQYGLHLSLSEIDPDSALLAIALCAQSMADKFLPALPIAATLKKEAEDIIGRYAPAWLYYQKHGPMEPEIFRDILLNVPEDLEALADLMDAFCADLDDNAPTSVEILGNLLSIQARAHMEISEYLLLEMHYEMEGKKHPSNPFTLEAAEMDAKEKSNASKKTGKDKKMAALCRDNIILFPMDRARQSRA